MGYRANWGGVSFALTAGAVAAVALAGALATGCGSDQEDEPIHNSVGPAGFIPNGEAPPAEWFDSSGRKYKLLGKASFKGAAVGELAKPQGEKKVQKTPPERLSVEEFAEHLRGVTVRGEYEYIAEPDLELARKVLDKLAHQDDADSREGRGLCCGNDDRVLDRNNTGTIQKPVSYNELGCSGVMISPSVLLTAAHCLYNGGWYQVPSEPSYMSTVWGGGPQRWPRWVNAMDGLDADAAPITHTSATYSYDVTYIGSFKTITPGAYLECYSPIVTAAWKTANHTVFDDYGFVDFGACGYSPGNLTGYWSPIVRTTTEITNATAYMYGYPVRAQPGTPVSDSQTLRAESLWSGAYFEAQLFTDNGTLSIAANEAYTLTYSTIDTSPGDSGAGIYQLVNGVPRLIGNHHSSYTLYNGGRRWDSTTDAFARLNTHFPN